MARAGGNGYSALMIARTLAAACCAGLILAPHAAADPVDTNPAPSPSTDDVANSLAQVVTGASTTTEAPTATVEPTPITPPTIDVAAPAVDTSTPVDSSPAPEAPAPEVRPPGVRADGSDAGEPQGALARQQGRHSLSSTQGYWRASAFFKPGQ